MKERLLSFLDPERSVPLYLLGTVAITLIIQFATDWSNEPGVWQGSYTLTLIVFILTIITFVVVWIQNRPKRLYLLEERKPARRKGLILLVSLHKASLPAAISYHQGQLQHCWLIATGKSLPVAAEIVDDFAGSDINFHFGTDFQVNDDDAVRAYQIASRILATEVPKHGLQPEDIIADITGGSKPMTAGLFSLH